ncbi:MAG: type II toxin-antitoxin system HicB family antitoxin [Pirellulales bacterium]
MMEYNGYHGVVQFDESAETFHGRVVGIRDVITFEGRAVDELRKAFEDSVDDYLEFCQKLDRPPNKPYSGKLILRMPEELHRELDVVCSTMGSSMNQFVVQALGDALARTGIGRSKDELEIMGS